MSCDISCWWSVQNVGSWWWVGSFCSKILQARMWGFKTRNPSSRQINCSLFFSSDLLSSVLLLIFVLFHLQCLSFLFSLPLLFSSSHPAPAGRGEPAKPYDGELHAVHLENTPAGPQTARKQQAPCSWTPAIHRPHAAPDAPVCSSCLRRQQPLHCKKPLGERGGGKAQPCGSERGQVQRLLQGPASPPPSSPPDQELWPAQGPAAAATYLQNGFLSHLGGPRPVGRHPHRERCCVRGWIWFHRELISTSSRQPWHHGARHWGNPSRWSPTAPLVPPG